jgi:hypothetical protein
MIFIFKKKFKTTRIIIMKKYTLQSILFMGLFFFSMVNANFDQNGFIEFARNEVFIPERLGNIKLYKDNYGFHIFKDGEPYDIQNCFCDSLLRKMSDEQLMEFLGKNKSKIIWLTPEQFDQIMQWEVIEITGPEKEELLGQLFGSGYIFVNQMGDGEYILHAKIRAPGGGLVVKVLVGVTGGMVGGIAGGILGGPWGAGGGFVGGAAVGVLGAAGGEMIGGKIGGEIGGEKGAKLGAGIGEIGGGIGAIGGGVVGGIVGVKYFGPWGAVGGVAIGVVGGAAIGGAAGGVVGGVVTLVMKEDDAPPVHDEENPAPQATPGVKPRIIEGTH